MFNQQLKTVLGHKCPQGCIYLMKTIFNTLSKGQALIIYFGVKLLNGLLH